MNNLKLIPNPPEIAAQFPINPLDVPSLILQALMRLEESNKSVIGAVETLSNKIDKAHAGSGKKKRWYTVKETMEELNRSDKAIYDLINRGLLKTDKSSGKLYIPASEIEAFEGRVI